MKRDEVAVAVGRLLPVLRLCDWTISLEDDPAAEDVQASIRPLEGRRHAQLYLCSDWEDLSEPEQCHTLVHELVHLHFAAAGDIIRLELPRRLSQECYEVLWEGFKRQVEYGVDALADALTPLIAWREP